MAGQQFQYDDSGNTFFYFLTSFVGLIVIPATYYLWPRDQNAAGRVSFTQAGLELASSHPPASAPRVAGLTDLSHCVRMDF
ncbi:SEC63 isoform 2 [Pan troglodytes]|uniref:SEC63 homolog, protein translocation regulator n=2 Tax=Homininae TaxID=207598 RepID=F8WB27_HUMAN|nr:SEC63 isoform 2 [Pan troglodytes]